MERYLSFYYFLLGICVIICPCLSDIWVIKQGSNKTIKIIQDIAALFGPSLPIEGLEGVVVYTKPPDACIEPRPPPKIPNYYGYYIALVRRYNCTFVNKVLNAQNAGYDAVIVRNVGSNDCEVMSGDNGTELVKIPSVFIGGDDGILLQESFQYSNGYSVIVMDEPFDIQKYLLSFTITVGLCFVLMLTLMLVKCIRDYRHSRRHRLSPRALKKLPIHKFKKGDPYECCAICLEDFADNDKLRILPCSHAYHSKCIDPWLTNNRRVCPVCKRKVLIGDEQPSDTDSDSEDETTPLINSDSGTQGGTFVAQRENPFQEAERLVSSRQQGESGMANHSRRNYAYLDESDTDSELETSERPSPSAPTLAEEHDTASTQPCQASLPDDDEATSIQTENDCKLPIQESVSSSLSADATSPTLKEPEVDIQGARESGKYPADTPKDFIV